MIERRDRMALVYKGSPPNHTCCDQALRILPDGTWVVVFMTGGVREPEVDNHVVLCRSTDQGMTWGKPEVVLQYPDRGATLSEVMVLDGRLVLMAQTHDGYFGQWRVWSLESADGGRTWSEPEPFAPCPRRSFVRNLYRASWGTWYLPVQSYPVVDDVDASSLRDGSHRLAENWVLRSDDEGQTWTPSEHIGPMAGWAENNVVELSDGRLTMLVRGDATGCLWRSESLDRGSSWTPWASTEIPNPGSKIRLFRDGTRFLLIILRITTLFSPFKVFFPASLITLVVGAGYYLYTYLRSHRFTNFGQLLIVLAVILFTLSLISEQIAQLRFDRSEDLPS